MRITASIPALFSECEQSGLSDDLIICTFQAYSEDPAMYQPLSKDE